MKSEADASLDAVLIGGREERAIVIVDYDPSRAQRFEAVAQTIRDAAGEKAVSVEHIGSAAVPGLAAKPIIDVLLTVTDVEDEAAYVPGLEEIPYVIHLP